MQVIKRAVNMGSLAVDAEFFRGLAKVLEVAGYLLMAVGAVTSVFFGFGGGLMLLGGGVTMGIGYLI